MNTSFGTLGTSQGALFGVHCGDALTDKLENLGRNKILHFFLTESILKRTNPGRLRYDGKTISSRIGTFASRELADLKVQNWEKFMIISLFEYLK